MTVVQYDPTARAVTRAGAGTFAADWLLDPAEIANRIGGTDFVPRTLRNNPAAITAALLYGAEVGLGPMQSLAKIAVIEGKPSLAAEAMRALILGDGHDLWIEESTTTRCTIAGRRRGSEMISRVTWTLDDAKRAKIAGKPPWQAYPRAMLLARASAELARAIFADVIGGMPATEEIEDGVDVDTAPAAAPAQDGEQPKAPTRRRRRVGTTSGPSPAAAPSPTEPEPTPQPSEPSDAAQPTQPPAEQATPLGGDQTPTEPAEPDAPNSAQTGMLFALFTEKGMKDRDDRLAWSKKTLGREIASSKELTALDVSRLIKALKALPDPPPAAPEPEPEAGALPADEQAVLDALQDELGAQPDDAFPAGY